MSVYWRDKSDIHLLTWLKQKGFPKCRSSPLTEQVLLHQLRYLAQVSAADVMHRSGSNLLTSNISRTSVFVSCSSEGSSNDHLRNQTLCSPARLTESFWCGRWWSSQIKLLFIFLAACCGSLRFWVCLFEVFSSRPRSDFSDRTDIYFSCKLQTAENLRESVLNIVMWVWYIQYLNSCLLASITRMRVTLIWVLIFTVDRFNISQCSRLLNTLCTF